MRRVNRGAQQALEYFRGGEIAKDRFLKRRIAAAKAEARTSYDAGLQIKQRAKAQFADALRTRLDLSDPKKSRAIEGLGALHKRLAKQKVKAPPFGRDFGGILSGSITAKFTPPFDYAYTTPFLTAGNPGLIGSAEKNGALKARATSDFNKRSVGTMYTEVGVFFRPTFGPARMRVSANPNYLRQWWTNSLRAEDSVRSFGSVVVGIFGSQGVVGPIQSAVGIADLWDEQTTQEIRFDFGSSPTVQATAELEVDPSFTYSAFVAAQTHIEALGWPGSLAGGVIALTVPSITIQLDLIPVFTSD